MTQSEFNNYSFRKATKVKVSYKGEERWLSVEGVDFEREQIDTNMGIYGISGVLEIRY